MTLDHTTIDELLAARALDGLEPDEAALLEREMADHGECETCRRLEAEHRETAGMLALVLEPRAIDPAVVEGILEGSGASSASPDRRLRRWQAAFGVAAVVAAALAFVLLTRPGADDVVPGRRFVSFEGGSGELAAAYVPGGRGLVVWGTDLPDPGAGKVYELWLIQDGTPTRGACLQPRDGALGAYLDTDLGGADTLALTVESSACPDAPTTDPVYTATVA
ncbi:MAG TPA: anti-sigma factor [Actinomycetota bacterium]|nr:anti-sigma factor [Actinomycetota bacterium]